MQKILVTGGAGFIGSCFVRTQLRNYPDQHVVVLDKLTYSGNLDNLKGLDETRISFIRGDVNNPEHVRHALEGCDGAVHFAAESHVDRSLSGASDFIATNVGGVNTLLSQARAMNLERILLVSTDEVYGSVTDGSSKEDSPILPRNPYSASKASGELIGLSYFESFCMPVIITRGSNTYGPNQYPEKVLPLFISNAIDNEPLPLYGDGRNVRDWLFVEDHCAGIDCAFRKGTPGESYNIAGENERENITLTRKVLSLLNRPDTLIRYIEDRTGHDRRYSIDSTKLKALGWEPKMNFDEGIAFTVKWYQENEWWWRKIKSGEFKAYYEEHYRERLDKSQGI